MRTNIFLALSAVLLFATSASADFTVSDAGVVSNPNTTLTPQGDYFLAPGLGSSTGGGFFLAGGGLIDSTINDATEIIGTDLGGGNVESSDLTTDLGGGTFSTLFTIVSTSGDLGPAGFVSPTDGSALDTLALFVGVSGGGTPIDFSGSTVVSAILDATDATGTSVIGGSVDLVSIGFDVQSGSFGVLLGPNVGLGVDTITLEVTTQKAIPEPTSLAILGGMGLGLLVRRRR